MQRVNVVVIKAVFQFGYLEEVEALEADVCLGECLGPLRLILVQQVEGGLVRLRVDDELRKVLPRHLWRITGHESRR